MTDALVPSDGAPKRDLVPPPKGTPIPPGSSVIHSHTSASEVWRLACRIRLGMRDEGLTLKDSHARLVTAYPDLEITTYEFQKFMEDYVDESIILGPGFFKKGLMRTQVKLNAVAEAAKIADRMQEAFERFDTDEVTPKDLPSYMLAGERAMKARERQYGLMDRIGMGAQTDQERAAAAKPVIQAPINIETAHFALSDAIGGSFTRRAPVDTEGTTKA